jgi:hypothetical protein
MDPAPPVHSSRIHPGLAKLIARVEGANMLRSLKPSHLRAAILAATVLLAGCVIYQEPAPVYQAKPVKIPPGHLPPPGQCRIWFPDRPPGHQPPPGPCHVLQYQVPPGAVLVHG